MEISIFYRLASYFSKHGFQAYLVGGSVRDYLLYGTFDDMDIATNASLQDMKTFLEFKEEYEFYQSGKIVFEGSEIDVTSLRKEAEYDDFRHPKKIEFVSTPQEEVERRDFTINALYMDNVGNVLDYVEGQRDLQNRIIRCVNNPEIRFEEDPLRMLRALRFAFKLNFELDDSIKRALETNKVLLKKLNYHKVEEELRKFEATPSQVREFLKNYNIDSEIPLFYEYNERNIFDLHCDTITKLYDLKDNIVKNSISFDLNKMQEGGYLGQVFAVFIDLKAHEYNPFQYALDVIDYYHQVIKENSSFIEEAYSYEDCLRIMGKGKRIAMLSIEEGGILQNDINRLDLLYQKGVRMMSLTWNYENCIGYPCQNENEGLTDFGKEVVRKMNSLGMIIDVSHLSPQGVNDVLKLSTSPIIASHSSIRDICDVKRNLYINQLKRIALNGGIVGINYYPKFVCEDKDNYFTKLVEHFKIVKENIGTYCLAFGSDFDGMDSDASLSDVRKIKTLVNQLRAEGFSIQDIQKIGYSNFFRLLKSVQK